MIQKMAVGLLIPLFGTVLGGACVFLIQGEMNRNLERGFQGFAAGIMTAASVWSLLIPAMEQSSSLAKWAFAPAVIGFLLGMGFLLLLDEIIPHQHLNHGEAEGPAVKLAKTKKMFLAVSLHNIPEGMAVGVVFAGILSGTQGITMSAAIALALGIAIQNFPEGAIVSLPLHATGMRRKQAFWYAAFSGAVEPIGAILTLLATRLVVPVLPYLLSFAAGAMLYVVVEELIPEMSEGEHSNLGPITYAFGFALMMALDVALG